MDNSGRIINKQNFNDIDIIKNISNKDNNTNQYPYTIIYENNTTLNTDSNMELDNSSKEIKIYSQNNLMNNYINDLNNQNINILNLDYPPRKRNSNSKIRIEKTLNNIVQNQENNILINSEYLLQTSNSNGDNNYYLSNGNINHNKKNSDSMTNFFNQNLEENKNFIRFEPKNINNKHKKHNSFGGNIKDYSKVNNKKESDNYQFIIDEKNRNHKVNGNISLASTRDMKINDIREELRLIHDNRKYNYDKKLHKINPSKIPIPTSKKIVERILGLNEKKLKNKKSIEERKNKNIILRNKPNIKEKNTNLKIRISPQKNIDINLNVNSKKDLIINNHNNHQQNMKKGNNVQNIIKKHNSNHNIIEHNQNISQKEYIKKINSNINLPYNVKILSINNDIISNENDLKENQKQSLNQIAQETLNVKQKSNPDQINYNDLKINKITQQNENIPQKSGLYINPSHQNLNIINNYIQQQNSFIEQKQINMNKPQDFCINYEQNNEYTPQHNLISSNQNILNDGSPSNVIFQKNLQNNIDFNLCENNGISPQPIFNISNNKNINNIIQQPSNIKYPQKRNINNFHQNSDIYYEVKQNLINLQQKSNIPQKQTQQQPNIIQNTQNISYSLSNINLNNNLKLLQQQDTKIHRNPNFRIIKNQNNIQENNLNHLINIKPNMNIKQDIINTPINTTNIYNAQKSDNILFNPQNMNNIEQQSNPEKKLNSNLIQNYQMNICQNNQKFIFEQRNHYTNNHQKKNNNIYQQNIVQDKEQIHQLQLIPDNTIIGNIIIKNNKAYYLNPILDDNNNLLGNNNNPNKFININILQGKDNLLNNNSIQKQNIHIDLDQNQNPNYLIDRGINNDMTKIINYNCQNNNQGIFPDNKIVYLNKNENHIQQNNQPQIESPQQGNKIRQQLKNGQKLNKKGKTSRAYLSKIKDSNDHKPAFQYKVERRRPVYAVPPSKKRSFSQGKPFTLINKYYDENYILEDDNEESLKPEKIPNIQITKNLSDDEGNKK